jgi:hypothetical protein
MIEPTTTIRRNDRVVFRNLPDGAVLLHLDTAAYHGVNEIGAAIWELLEPSPTFEGLVGSLRDKLDEAPENLPDEVGEYLEDLAERGLVHLGADDAEAQGSQPSDAPAGD